jgi:thymidylate synthase
MVSLSTQAAISVRNNDEAVVKTLDDLLTWGKEVRAGTSLSVGSGRRSRDIANYMITVDEPWDRLIWNPYRKLDLPLAAARFVWMMAGSNRLADIAFYDERVRFFSDDGVSVPGSNFGQRILQPQPGVNQLDAAITLLRNDSATRRAVISVYHALDCGRDSRDIPCLLSIAYSIRDGTLHATTLMRSNNAFGLLPYNLFELSLLAEIVAAELNLPLGPLTHFALSMHLYEEDVPTAQRVTTEPLRRVGRPLPIRIPYKPAPLRQVQHLVALEMAMRYASAALNEKAAREWLARSQEELQEPWRSLFTLLLLQATGKRGDEEAHRVVLESLAEPWRSYLVESSE